MLDDLHPILRDQLHRVAEAYHDKYPDRGIALITAHRSVQAQQNAYEKGRSKLDGVKRPSRHNYKPSFAFDAWPLVLKESASQHMYIGRPPRDEAGIILSAKMGLHGDLDLDGDGDIDSRDVVAEYQRLAQVEDDLGFRLGEDPRCGAKHMLNGQRFSLRWGGSWREHGTTPARFFDGPHYELPPMVIHAEFQRLLFLAGHDPGRIDGLFGGKTSRAAREAARRLGVKDWYCSPTSKIRLTPALWQALWQEVGNA